jgi:hypothetical protein
MGIAFSVENNQQVDLGTGLKSILLTVSSQIDKNLLRLPREVVTLLVKTFTKHYFLPILMKPDLQSLFQTVSFCFSPSLFLPFLPSLGFPSITKCRCATTLSNDLDHL